MCAGCQVAFKDSAIFAVHEDWEGGKLHKIVIDLHPHMSGVGDSCCMSLGAGNGLGTLYAFKKACDKAKVPMKSQSVSYPWHVRFSPPVGSN